jgi:uncharacterized coiled-coil protein SlyX
MTTSLRISTPISMPKADPTPFSNTPQIEQTSRIADSDKLRYHRLSGLFDRKPTVSAQGLGAQSVSHLRPPKNQAIKKTQEENRRFSMPVMAPPCDTTVDHEAAPSSANRPEHPLMKNIWQSGDRAEPKQTRLLKVGPRLFTQADEDHVSVMHKDVAFLQQEKDKVNGENNHLKEALLDMERHVSDLESKIGHYRNAIGEAERKLKDREARVDALTNTLTTMTSRLRRIETAAHDYHQRLAQAFGHGFSQPEITLAPALAQQKPIFDMAGEDFGMGVASSSASTSSKV